MKRWVRRGACPSLFAPMQTGDGLLARVAPESGNFTPAELSAVVNAAHELGNGVIEVSWRGNFQFRGFTEESARAFRERVEQLGIAVRRGIPVVSNALAGLDTSATADPSALTLALGHEIAASAMTKRLAPKASVIVEGGGRYTLAGLIGDVRLVAVAGGGWAVQVGGTQASARLAGYAENDATALEAAMAILDRISFRGTAARGRDLKSAELAAISSLRQDCPDPADAPSPVNIPVGTIRLVSGQCAVGAAPPFGMMDAATIGALCEAAAMAGCKAIRPAPGKAILCTGIPEAAACSLSDAAAALGFITAPDDPRLNVVCCAGAPYCDVSHLDTQAIARDLASSLGAFKPGALLLHLSGCGKRCAVPGFPAVELCGEAAGVFTSIPGEAPRMLKQADAVKAVRQFVTSRSKSAPIPEHI